jgi:hypothetical protein
MARIALLAVLLTALLAAPAHAYDDAGYLAYMDRMELRLDSLWDAALQRYTPGRDGTDTTFNANLLLVHAVAALREDVGPARRDARARALVRALLHAPPYVRRPYRHGADSQVHAPGWASSMDRPGDQHVMIDAEVVDGLAHAWLARRQLGLSRRDADRIATAIHRVAHSSFWQWPSIRLNQINWYALIYAADATVGGPGGLLRDDLRRQIHRFAAAASGNFGPGLHFHYLPARSAGSVHNVDTAEYASIVASFTRFYVQARRAGMRPPSPADRRLLRAWLTRVLAGYWTHSGYLNWDSGLGFHRWHQAKKLGLAQQALIGMATAPTLLADRRYGAYAKWILDRGLAFYERQAVRAGGIAPGLFFGVHVIPQSVASARLAAAREASNAARALDAGLGRAPAAEPPPMYAYDPDIGRLAITTPVYNTAIVAVSQGAFPYGGIELARLFDADQEVAAGIGGRAPAAFGLVVRNAAGRSVLATQSPRTRLDRRVTPLRLTRAPVGVAATAMVSPTRAYAGPFRDLRATGSVSTRALRADVSHRFTAGFIDTGWVLRRRSGRARYSVDALFPSWGHAARIDAVLRTGSVVPVAGAKLAVAGVERFLVHSDRSGYAVIIRRAPEGAVAHVVATVPQPSAPDPGPTLAIDLTHRFRTGRVALEVRLVPDGRATRP